MKHLINFKSYLTRLRGLTVTLIVLFSFAIGNARGTVVSKSWTGSAATSGTVDTYISYSSSKGNGTSNPASNASGLRIYKPSSGNSAGGYITISAASGYEISSVTFTNSNDKAGTVAYSIDGGSISSTSSLAKQGTFTYNSSNFSYINFYNCGGDRLTIASVSVTYAASGGGGGTPTCATPTFSPAAGTYIGTQSVTISSTTTGSTIYYTTDGSTPTTSSSHGTAGAASATVSVSSSQTLKAIAVKAEANDSEVGTAIYTIISCSSDDFDWDLSTNSYDASPTTELIQWSGTYATMKNERNGSGNTAVNNYIPTSNSSSRFYSGNKLTITPASGVTISQVVFTATTDGYSSSLRTSTWNNATASGSGKYVIVTPTDGTSAFYSSVGGTCGFTNVNVCYSAGSTYTLV